MRPPTIKIQNFGGGTVNVLSQATVGIHQGDYQCEATVLIQKGSALEFLLGTDVLARLGFDLVQTKQDGGAISLLERHKIPNPHPIVTPSSTETENNDQ